MNLVGLMPCRNEDWVLALSARVALMWCDRLVILNHASTDDTDRIVSQLTGEFKNRVESLYIHAQQWDEMNHRQQMLQAARCYGAEISGATHIAIIDADEILTGNLLSGIRERVAALSAGQMLQLPGYNMRGGLNRYHLNGVWGQRWFSTAFKDVNTAAWKGDKFHAREPQGVRWEGWKPVKQGEGGTMHLWGASERRLIAKHALYQITEALRWPDKDRDTIRREYSQALVGRPWIGDSPKSWTFQHTPDDWWTPYFPLLHHLHVDAEPWQEAEVKRLVAEHGTARFQGLDLFGVA
jgi:hypothetical protein